MPATMCCHDLLMRNAMLSAYTPMCVSNAAGGTPAELLETPFSDLPCSINCRTTCGSAVDAGGAVGPYCLTLADEDILAKNEIVDPSIGLQKRKEWGHVFQGAASCTWTRKKPRAAREPHFGHS
ncbi:uncharacterized protein LOC121832999 [Ixodes scapularis]|uniref:uncharacterized protein LOC121832999 n=1 Tax=Ixodes scapularis TaxID=6945 RepID=UPI001C380C29|nr:uncharacterized protein LOC121832999 [Ixodes scapularis]